jgi:hypothetical protein
VSLVARLQSFTLVTKTELRAPAGNSFLPARRMVLNGNSAFAVPGHSSVDAIHFYQGALAAGGAWHSCFGGFCLQIQEVA